MPILQLGTQKLTGVFPREDSAFLTEGPLDLVKCHKEDSTDSCGLVQLCHSYDANDLYGSSYGYRSGLNRSMVEHLTRVASSLRRVVQLQSGELVVDIGSNDGTLLSCYPEGTDLVGIDPTAGKFRRFYRRDIAVVEDFFSFDLFAKLFGDRKARIVSSIAMFYDLDKPIEFMKEVRSVLASDGIWHFEQSYLPAMLRATAYDTICHEHVEYYGLRQIKYMSDRVGLKIIDLRINEVNGGSFAVTAARSDAPYRECTQKINKLLDHEQRIGLDSIETYHCFEKRIRDHRTALLELLHRIRHDRGTVLGYGASTKGNVILQFCGITPELIPLIGEVNEDKFGCLTPGSNIPIVPEQEVKALKPDFLLVLPWHFRKNLVAREREYVRAGGTLIFPLPRIDLVTR